MTPSPVHICPSRPEQLLAHSPAIPSPDLQLQLQDLCSLQKASPMGYLTTHPLPTPGSLGKQPELPQKIIKKTPFPSPPHSQHHSPPAQDEVWGAQKKGAGTKYSWGGQRFIFHPLERAEVYFPSLSKAANTPLFMFTPSICTPPFCSLLLHSQCLQRPRAGFAAQNSVPGACGATTVPSTV